jgi:phasin family protein
MADAAETTKKTVENATAKAQAQAEKIQAAGAQAVREGMDKSMASMSELSVQAKKNLDAVVESAAAAQKGTEALTKQAAAYSRKSWEDGIAAAQSLTQARSVQEMIELQTSFTKSAIELYVAEMNKAAEVMTASVKDSFKPINERVTASVEKFQAAR